MTEMMNVMGFSYPQLKKPEKQKQKEKEIEVQDIVLRSCVDPHQMKSFVKMSPKEALEWVAVIDAVGALVARFGPGILDIFRPRQENPAEDQQHALKLDTEKNFEYMA